MDKLGNFVNTVKESDFVQESGGGELSDKLIKCLAVIGVISTAKTLWKPLRQYMLGKHDEEVETEESRLDLSKSTTEQQESVQRQPRSQKAAQLKERYGGDWALFTDSTEPTSRKLAVELAREGYNLIFIVRKEGAKEEKISTSTSKYGVQVEFITAENYMQMGNVCEGELQDKDISIVVTGLAESHTHPRVATEKEQDAFSLTFSQQIFMTGVILPKLLAHHELTGKRGALIHVLSTAGSHIGTPVGGASPERSPHHQQHFYSAWNRAFSFTFGLGIIEQFKDQVDVLTAVKPDESQNLNESQIDDSTKGSGRYGDLSTTSKLDRSDIASGEGFKIQEIVQSSDLKDTSEEKKVLEEEELRKLQELEQDQLLRDFEYVPLQLLYQNLQAQKGSPSTVNPSHQIGKWPFTKEINAQQQQQKTVKK